MAVTRHRDEEKKKGAKSAADRRGIEDDNKDNANQNWKICAKSKTNRV